MSTKTATSITHAVVEASGFLDVLDVVIDSRKGGLDAIYTYANPLGAEVGDAVVVPLGPRSEVGFVLARRQVKPYQLGFAVSSLRPIQGRVDGVRLPAKLMAMLEYVADATLSTPSGAVSLATPPGLKDRIVTTWRLDEAALQSCGNLTIAETEATRVLRDHGGELSSTKTTPLSTAARKQLRSLKSKGCVQELLTVALQSERHRLTGQLRLTPDEPQIEKFLTANGKKKPAQAMALMRLQGAGAISFSAQEIKALCGATDQTIFSLLKAGLLEKLDHESYERATPPQPNAHQQAAIDAISTSVLANDPKTFLLYGVTGSGKTEVYLRTAAEALRHGRQVLYLVPEIALTAQVIAHLRSRFGRGLAVLHSTLPPQERMANWLQIARGQAPVVLGARSALFAPLENIGLIIMDEEHENSYKQESAPRYHSREAAIELARLHACPLILGSATPSIESFFEAQHGRIELLRLPQRAASAKLPAVQIVNLADVYKSNRPSIFSPTLMEKMTATLERKEQVILFLNRRAYAPFLVCRDCGHQWKCPQCAVTLSFHKRLLKLKCHHCGFDIPAPADCPSCEGLRIAPFGTGSERVEDAVKDEFPGVSVARLDRDVAEKRGALEEILAGFRSQSIQVLVGTQMVAKGLDFPNVTLVGVIAADISLNIPDFRASERTFQLLSQVAGRAGRGTRPGEVVIQTLSPENEAVRCAATHDYETLYQQLLAERQDALYPPFCRLVNVVASSESQDGAREVCSTLASRLRKLPDLRVLGPVECPLERLHGLWRFHLLIKLPHGAAVAALRSALENPAPQTVQVMVDVNPYSLM